MSGRVQRLDRRFGPGMTGSFSNDVPGGDVSDRQELKCGSTGLSAGKLRTVGSGQERTMEDSNAERRCH